MIGEEEAYQVAFSKKINYYPIFAINGNCKKRRGGMEVKGGKEGNKEGKEGNKNFPFISSSWSKLSPEQKCLSIK